MKIEKPYLVLPIGYTARGKKLCFYQEEKLALELDVPVDVVAPDYNQYLDVSNYLGQELTLVTDPEIDLELQQADEIPAQEFYGEKYRPQAHFSPKKGWINDPNGLVYDGKNYHLFYQHNPYSHQWSNMTWGHAVSADLLHWNELEPALVPDELGTMFSGSAIMDKENRTGLKENENDVMLLYYTAAGGTSLRSKGKKFTQCMAYSTDNGKTFRKYDGNPVVDFIEAENRDPKVIYVPELSAYVMAVFLNENRYILFTSQNLLSWERLQELPLPGDAECPDLYPLALDGDSSQKRWILSGASDRYLVGDFSSGTFAPKQEAKRLHYGRNSYAAQTYSDIPEADGRRLRIAWNTTQTPGTKFCGSMCIPCEIKLQTIDGEELLTAWPIQEVASLFRQEETRTLVGIAQGKTILSKRSGRAQWLEFTVDASDDAIFELSLYGERVEINVAEKVVCCMGADMPLCQKDGKIHLLILADATGFEIYCGQGQAFQCMGFLADYTLNRLEVNLRQGEVHQIETHFAQLESVWQED